MKTLHLFIAAILLFSLGNVKAQSDNATLVKEFLKDIPAATSENINAHAPVAGVSAVAKKNAAKSARRSQPIRFAIRARYQQTSF